METHQVTVFLNPCYMEHERLLLTMLVQDNAIGLPLLPISFCWSGEVDSTQVK